MLTYTLYFYCAICFEHRPLDRLRVFPCGHGCCVGCSHPLFSSGAAPCPKCRQACLREECHSLFVDFSDRKICLAKTVVHGIDAMDESVKLVSLERASSKIKKVCTELEPDDNELALELLQALANFQERIPVFQDLEQQSREILALKKDRTRLHNENQRLQTESANLRKTHSDIKTLRAERDHALKLAETATQETLSLRKTNAVLSARDQESESSLHELKTKLDKHIRASERNKVKMQQLVNENLLLKDQLAKARSDNDPAKSKPAPQKEPLPLPSRQLQPLSTNTRDFDGMPQPGFGSDWGNQARDSGLKRKWSDGSLFTIRLDNKGHPVVPVQIGPKRSRRVAPA